MEQQFQRTHRTPEYSGLHSFPSFPLLYFYRFLVYITFAPNSFRRKITMRLILVEKPSLIHEKTLQLSFKRESPAKKRRKTSSQLKHTTHSPHPPQNSKPKNTQHKPHDTHKSTTPTNLQKTEKQKKPSATTSSGQPKKTTDFEFKP